TLESIDLPLRVLFEFSTPQSLARKINVNENLPYTPILPLRNSGTKRPVFCVHPGGGFGTVYQNFAKALGNDYPVWAFQARGLEINEAPHTSIKEMAADYIDAMRNIQPSGPYLLLGWSFGGNVAQEMTVQLETIGERVELLILLDTAANFPKNTDRLGSHQEKLQNELEKLSQELDLKESSISLEDEALLKKIIDRLIEQKIIPLNTDIVAFRRILNIYVNNLDLMSAHKTNNCSCPILLARAVNEPTPNNVQAFEWEKYTDKEVIEENINSTHGNMWEVRPTEEIANCFKNYLKNKHKLLG
ncbi:MAG: alpha/beta fold hydrolase, partial [Paracoccaceae bacterium]